MRPTLEKLDSHVPLDLALDLVLSHRVTVIPVLIHAVGGSKERTWQNKRSTDRIACYQPEVWSCGQSLGFKVFFPQISPSRTPCKKGFLELLLLLNNFLCNIVIGRNLWLRMFTVMIYPGTVKDIDIGICFSVAYLCYSYFISSFEGLLWKMCQNHLLMI